MKISLPIIVLFFFSSQVVFSQKKISINGKVIQNENEVAGAIIQLNISGVSKKLISGTKGEFKFAEISANPIDTVKLKVFYIGYKTENLNIIFPKKDTTITISLKEIEDISLKEVTVKGEKSTTSNAYRSVYKINSKDFIKNTRGDKVLKTVPNISIQNDDILVDGRSKAIVFINGIESDNQELKSISVDDIDKIEVIDNPSASYNSDFTGSVINVILKTKVNNYIKGSISATGGTRNDYWSIFPTIAFKRGSFVLSSYYSRVDNSQKVDYNLDRQNTDGTFYNQTSVRKPDGYQGAFNTKLTFGLSKKSKLNFSNDISGYKFKANTAGFYNSDISNGNVAFTNNNSVEKQNRWSIASVYSYVLNPKNTFYLKAKFFKYNNIDIFNITDNTNQSEIGNIQSTTDEVTAEADHALSNVHLFKKQTEIYSGLKLIKRQFELVSDGFKVDQNSVNIFSEVSTKISERFSSMIGLSFENTNNSNSQLNQNYNYLLPTLNLVYKAGKNNSIKGGYSRKIIRPSANNLNNQLIFINPESATQGNKNLNPQIRDYSFLTFTTKVKNGQLSFKIFNESISQAIIGTYRLENRILISTLENAATNQATGFSLGLTTKLWGELSLNVSSGLDYNKFKANSDYSIVKENHGFTSRSNINLTSNIIKKKVALTFYGFYNSPIYTLINRQNVLPYLGFDSESNLFKDKLNIRLSYNNIFAWNAKRIERSAANAFNQTIITRNNTSNLLLSLSYFFGKKFSSSIQNSTIDNDDIIIK